jgi:ABC-2 type transport system ATP-binding protein
VVQLSGGQRQRLAVACALVGDPELLFLDEPTTGLDPQSRRQLWDVINAFRTANRSVMLTTHYMDEAERLCDRVAIVDQGKIIALGTPRELIAQVGGEHVIEFSVRENGQPLEPERLKQLASVVSVRPEQSSFLLAVTEPHVALPALLDGLKQDGRELATLTTRHATLEDVFVNLTGRHLRDGEASTG